VYVVMLAVNLVEYLTGYCVAVDLPGKDGGALRDKSECRFRKTATEYDRIPGTNWLSCTAK
jgi:hypothetical protein